MTQHKLNVIRKKTGSKSEQIVIGLFLANLKVCYLVIIPTIVIQNFDVLFMV